MKQLLICFFIGFYLFGNLPRLHAQNAFRNYREMKREERAEKLRKSRTFYDLEGKEISQDEFYKQRRENGYFSWINDSLNEGRLTKKWGERGPIDYREFVGQLNSTLSLDMAVTKPMVIVYYPGIDACSLTGSTRAGRLKYWYRKLERMANEVTPTIFLYIYKTPEELVTKEVRDWHKDPDRLVEKNFFVRHYPCGGFAVVSPKNKFISVFGEFSQESVVEVLKKLHQEE